MKSSVALDAISVAIRRMVEAHRARNARVIGSVLRDQDTDGSDLDIRIDPTPETSLMAVSAIQAALQQLLGLRVDALSPKALLEASRSLVLPRALPA